MSEPAAQTGEQWHGRRGRSLQPRETGTLVTWTLTGPTTFMTKLMGVFLSMDKMLGGDFEKGLANLEAEVEVEAETGTA